MPAPDNLGVAACHSLIEKNARRRTNEEQSTCMSPSERTTITLKSGISVVWPPTRCRKASCKHTSDPAPVAVMRISSDEYRHIDHLYNRRSALPVMVEEALKEVKLSEVKGLSARDDLKRLRRLTRDEKVLKGLCDAAVGAANILSYSRPAMLNQSPLFGDLPLIWPADAFWQMEVVAIKHRAIVICVLTGPTLPQEALVEKVRACLPKKQTTEYTACQLRLKNHWPRAERPIEPLRDYFDERCRLFVVQARDNDFELLADDTARKLDDLCKTDNTAQQGDNFRCERTLKRHQQGYRKRRPIQLTSPLVLEVGNGLSETKRNGALRFDISSNEATIVLSNPLLATTAAAIVAFPFRLVRPYQQITV